ncbi:MAG: hypothetical protein ABJC26_17750 [Gemmatimonadaceae bacterium]
MAQTQSLPSEVPKSLRRWFVLHFWADIIFAIPLIVFPVRFLEMLGWTSVDPVSARLVGAALVAIGVESLLGRNASIESFRTMLRLKVIWSATATVGLLLSIIGGAPRFTWVFLCVFAGFFVVWFSYWRRLRAHR